MSILNITELAQIGRDNGGQLLQVAKYPAVTTQEITISGTSAQSAAFNAETRIIRICADANCPILVGSNPTALATSTRILADSAEYIEVPAGYKIAAITG